MPALRMVLPSPLQPGQASVLTVTSHSSPTKAIRILNHGRSGAAFWLVSTFSTDLAIPSALPSDYSPFPLETGRALLCLTTKPGHITMIHPTLPSTTPPIRRTSSPFTNTSPLLITQVVNAFSIHLPRYPHHSIPTALFRLHPSSVILALRSTSLPISSLPLLPPKPPLLPPGPSIYLLFLYGNANC